MFTRKVTSYARSAVLISLFSSIMATSSWAATYYVATTGNNGNNGSLTAPFASVQYAVNLLQPGDTCLIRSGTYNEALLLKQSGTSSAPITIKAYSGETVTINSAGSKAVRTGGRKHYYTIDGLRFTSSHVVYSSGNDFSLDFGDGVWDGNNVPTGGNNGFIVRNCYIEGAVYFYGHNNLVENCEVNGKSLWSNGIHDAFGSSHDNIYRKNTVHDFTNRGIWSMSYTSNIVIENNTIYKTPLIGIDCDGAGHPVHYSVVRGNTIYNAAGRGIEMENAFNSIVEGNIVHDADIAIHYINYGFGTDFTSDAEYRTTPTNGMVRNNLVYNTYTCGILLRGAPSVKVYNNTVYKNGITGKTYYGGIGIIKYGGYFAANADVRNNILAENNPYSVYIDNTAAGVAGILQMSNNIYYNSTSTKTYFLSGANQTLTLSGFMTATGLESSSLNANPNFIGPAQANFHLLSTSPAISKGLTLTEVSVDLEGIPRAQHNDLGAYEFSTVPSPPAQFQFLP